MLKSIRYDKVKQRKGEMGEARGRNPPRRSLVEKKKAVRQENSKQRRKAVSRCQENQKAPPQERARPQCCLRPTGQSRRGSWPWFRQVDHEVATSMGDQGESQGSLWSRSTTSGRQEPLKSRTAGPACSPWSQRGAWCHSVYLPKCRGVPLAPLSPASVDLEETASAVKELAVCSVLPRHQACLLCRQAEIISPGHGAPAD